jgi:predicted GNAT family N-acyltransferase
MKTEFRPARVQEMDEIYLMGYDAWSYGRPVEKYLAECRASKNYQSCRWFVLCDGAILRSSILIHTFDPWGEQLVRGIGSVATQLEFRRHGYGNIIVKSALSYLMREENPEIIFLYSDIGEAFYKRHGFLALATQYQTKQTATLMVRMLPEYDPTVVEQYKRNIPGYF